MSSANKKAYIYKMKLIPANILCLIITVALFIVTFAIYPKNLLQFDNTFVVLFLMIVYMMLHEILHGIGYIIGGGKSKNVKYGMALEKGIFYAMAYEELTKKNILISLQMPFTFIGVITYILGIIFDLPLLVLFSIINLSGAAMDIVMFIYISKLKNITYSESGQPDEFVLISQEDLTKKKNIFLEITKVKEYKKEDYIFDTPKKLEVSKTSLIILIALIVLSILDIFII